MSLDFHVSPRGGPPEFFWVSPNLEPIVLAPMPSAVVRASLLSRFKSDGVSVLVGCNFSVCLLTVHQVDSVHAFLELLAIPTWSYLRTANRANLCYLLPTVHIAPCAQTIKR